MFPIAQHLDPIYKHMRDPGRVLMRLFIGGVVLNARRIKHHHISKVPLLQSATPRDSEVIHRQGSQPANGFLQRNYFFVPHVFPEESGKIAVGTRMRVGLLKRTLGRE